MKLNDDTTTTAPLSGVDTNTQTISISDSQSLHVKKSHGGTD